MIRLRGGDVFPDVRAVRHAQLVPAHDHGGRAAFPRLKEHLSRPVIDAQPVTEYVHHIAPVRSGHVHHTTFGKADRVERTGVDYFCQLMVVEAVAVSILPQHEAHHIFLPVQSDPVRKDMRHETGLFFYGVQMDAGLDDLRDERNGTGQYLIEPVGKTCLDAAWRHGNIPPLVGVADSHSFRVALPRPRLDRFTQSFG